MTATASPARGDLTKNQALVFATLENADAPMSAYTILDQLRGKGLRAPLQVYRALDKLLEFGLVHRLECLNAFVACNRPDCGNHGSVAFAICDACGKVSEFADPSIVRKLKRRARDDGFDLKTTTIELRGTCAGCVSA